jgi:hypothetical protein
MGLVGDEKPAEMRTSIPTIPWTAYARVADFATDRRRSR